MLAASPAPFTWGHYVDALIAERGSLSELARHLLDVAPPSALVEDPGTVERGLRRLRARGNAPGEKYGRLLLRCLGLPAGVEALVGEVGRFHSRSADLPTRVRRDQLRLWDRPPITEGAAAAWVHLALATLAHHDGDLEAVERRLALARLGAAQAGDAARAELALFEARVLSDRGEPAAAAARLDEAGAAIDRLPTGDDAACYAARLLDQRAYLRSRPWRTDTAALREAVALYESIPVDGAPPFAAFRRWHGLAWCLWRADRPRDALRVSEHAARVAGDGGHVRLRYLSLSLQARILADLGRDPAEVTARARAIAARLGDDGPAQRG